MDLSSLRAKMRARLPDAIGELRQLAQDHAPDFKREPGYTINNATSDEAVVRIYDEIWFLGVNAVDFVRDLDTITAPRMRVEINSPGGDVFDGIAIYNALRTHPAHVTTRVDGIAASIASVIAQAGDRRIMLSSSQMMIHNAWGMTVGDHQDHAEMSALLAQQDDIIAGIYASRSGGDKDNFRTLMDAETWLSDQRAVDEGLADEVIEPDRKGTPQDRGPTLNDKIASAVSAVADAVSSAEQVSAIRAEAGKTLSVVNRESLVGLRDAIERIDGLLSTEDPSDTDDVDRIAAEYARFVALTQGVMQ
jgi:ATP-dependent protease ClpP protease subunit